jgi:hypothetical protein
MLKEHAGLVALFGSTALIAARLLAISRFDVNTAATVLQVSGTGAAVAGTALTLLPFALVLVACLLAAAVFVDPRLLGLPPGVARAALWLTVGAVLCLTALPLVVLTLVAVAGAAAVGRYLRRRGGDTDITAAVRSSGLLRFQATLLLAVTVLTPVVLQRPWLPVQAVVLENGAVHVGYLLGDADGRLAVMSDADRTVRFVRTEAVLDRFICTGAEPAGLAGLLPRLELRGSLAATLLWGDDAPSYPPCPPARP